MRLNLTFLIYLLLVVISCSQNREATELTVTEEPLIKDAAHTIDGERHYINEYLPLSDEGGINVVVEIPTGTNAKWEVNKATGDLNWEIRNGKPRVVQYLGYPGNYGMIPGTLLPRELGGDGDPLDVIVLGPAVERGKVISVKLIGVMELLDNGEQDDKLIAVSTNTPFYKHDNLESLDSAFNGIDEIIQLWFENYKGPGKMQFIKFGDQDRANEILQASIDAFQAAK